MTKIEVLEKRLRKLRALLRQRDIFAEQAIEDITVEAIKTKMYAENYSIRIIDEVIVGDVKITTNKIKYTIINELLVGSGFDVAEGREGGIPPHTIRGNPYLAFRAKTITGAPTSLIIVASVEHPGLEATHIIRDTVREKQYEVAQRYKQLVNNKIQEIKNSS